MNSEHVSAYPSQLRHFALSTVENNEYDVTILRYMIGVARHAANQLQSTSPKEPIVVQTRDILAGVKIRVVTNTTGLQPPGHLPFVGFISKKQMQVAQDIQSRITAADSGMLLELAKIPALLSYVSLQLVDENWFNLVLFSHESAKHAILTTSLHHHAAYHLAPHYYQWIRLHHGIMQQDATALELTLHTTKYYSFSIPAAAPTISIQAHQPVHTTAGIAAR